MKMQVSKTENCVVTQNIEVQLPDTGGLHYNSAGVLSLLQIDCTHLRVGTLNAGTHICV